MLLWTPRAGYGSPSLSPGSLSLSPGSPSLSPGFGLGIWESRPSLSPSPTGLDMGVTSPSLSPLAGCPIGPLRMGCSRDALAGPAERAPALRVSPPARGPRRGEGNPGPACTGRAPMILLGPRPGLGWSALRWRPLPWRHPASPRPGSPGPHPQRRAARLGPPPRLGRRDSRDAHMMGRIGPHPPQKPTGNHHGRTDS